MKGYSAISKAPASRELYPSDCLVSYPAHLLEGSYPSAEMQSVYFTVPADCIEHYSNDLKKKKITTDLLNANLVTDVKLRVFSYMLAPVLSMVDEGKLKQLLVTEQFVNIPMVVCNDITFEINTM